MKILILTVFVYIVAIFLGSTYEGGTVTGSWAGTGNAGYVAGQTPVETLNYLMNMSNAIQHTPIIGNIPLPIPNGQYFAAWFNLLTLQFTFMKGYEMFYYILILPFAIWAVVSLALLTIAAIRGNITWG